MTTSAEKELAIVLEMLGFSKNGKYWEHAYSKKKTRDPEKAASLKNWKTSGMGLRLAKFEFTAKA
ncbi:hypothetical protein [Enterococcus pallens]|uniref:Uncharacterized protein n=1 Tax=Enterococcus pallens ATCC BAA-351 TaxID=1158607 RepID=R2Q2W0_9ENTE|nr:hypothetical protein [Enterococcus pallens]EOH90907.1 hypothetical protein UAU_03446 [Enterococcus pallens ATCC BAA-351]EOU16103.1 hypothetical protein I588_03759 [Enterococcus pallens ATCC BAA-351]OJG77422.1 hypothetical protein RV10_GL002532 [Enterococcus pallens]